MVEGEIFSFNLSDWLNDTINGQNGVRSDSNKQVIMSEKKRAWMPEIIGDWWQIPGNPDLGECQSKRQQALDFGVDSDRYLIGSLAFEVVRIIKYGADYYISALNPDYNGIRLARMKWVLREVEESI